MQIAWNQPAKVRSELRLASYTGSGTMLVSRQTIAKMNNAQWEKFFKSIYAREGIRVLIYGDETKDAVFEKRWRNLKRFSQVKPIHGSAERALIYLNPSQGGVFVTADGLLSSEENLLKDPRFNSVKAVKIKNRAEPIGVALLYLLMHGRAELRLSEGIYLEDPSGRYMTVLTQYFRDQVVAFSA